MRACMLPCIPTYTCRCKTCQTLNTTTGLCSCLTRHGPQPSMVTGMVLISAPASTSACGSGGRCTACPCQDVALGPSLRQPALLLLLVLLPNKVGVAACAEWYSQAVACHLWSCACSDLSKPLNQECSPTCCNYQYCKL